jgi:antitoxin FitA
MTNITIPLPDDRLAKLQELASRLRISPEELVRLSIEDLLGRPDEAFEQAARHILKKNEDLYRRLA